MNNVIKEYLTSFSPPLQASVHARIVQVVDVFTMLRAGEEPEVLFISDSIGPSGERVYESLWGFQGPFWMEARGFVNLLDVDVSPYQGSIMYLGMKHDDLAPLELATEDTEMRVEVETENVRYSLLTATGANRDHLMKIVEYLLIPALKYNSQPNLSEA